ncbi:hypothetical protein ACLOJK_027763 [Asimina triloba]
MLDAVIMSDRSDAVRPTDRTINTDMITAPSTIPAQVQLPAAGTRSRVEYDVFAAEHHSFQANKYKPTDTQRKGMRSSFRHSSPSPDPSSPSGFRTWPNSPLHLSFSESLMDGNVAAAEAIITRWDPEKSSYAKVTSLFYEHRREAREYLQAARNLQRSMHFYISQSPVSEKLVHTQRLMKIAMKRLEKEFYQILAANRDMLDPESVSARSSTTAASSVSDYDDDVGSDDEIQVIRNSIQEVEREASLVMSDLRAIAECMIASGYGKECLKIYKSMRKSIVEEGIYRLGFEHVCSKQIEKMEWMALERKIKNWISVMRICFKTLFYGERMLCDQVLTGADSVREGCFSEIAKEAAAHLLQFPETVTRCRKSPEKIFRFLDLYDTISELWPDLESIFSYESTSEVRTQAINSLVELGDGIRAMLAQFESAIQKHPSRSAVPGGGLHPLTRYAMNYLSFLSDYSEILSDIFPDFQPQSRTRPPPQTVLLNTPTQENPQSAIAARLEWLIFTLLCKLDKKAECYKDVGLSYLFLANNLNYVVSKVNGCNLRYIIGDEWVSKHTSKIQQYAANYRSTSWKKVISALPEEITADISPPQKSFKTRFDEFNSAFEAACRAQSGWAVPDEKLREEIKESVAKMMVPGYRLFVEKYEVLSRSGGSDDHLLRFSAEDLENYISDLFSKSAISGSASGSASGSSSHSRR